MTLELGTNQKKNRNRGKKTGKFALNTLVRGGTGDFYYLNYGSAFFT
jgi:hypothetical protein